MNGLPRIAVLALWPAMAACFSAAGSQDTLPPGRPELEKLYEEAKDSFRQANENVRENPELARDLYLKAAVRFEKIAGEGGIRNGKLYYNLANAYFRMEDLGKAILNYRRAEQYIPNDLNLHQNLEYARERRLDKVEVKQAVKILGVLFFWHYDLSAGTRGALFACLFALLWVAAAARLFNSRFLSAWIPGILVAICLFLAGSLAAETISLRRDRPGVVIRSEVVARQGDGETFEPAFKEPLHAGTEFLMKEDRGEWLRIELVDGRSCWVPSASVELVR